MNGSYMLLKLKFFLILTCFINAYAMDIFDFGYDSSSKTFRIEARIRKIFPESLFEAPVIDNFCIGNTPQCFPVILNLHEQNTYLLDKSVSNCGFNPAFDSLNSRTFHKGTMTYTYVETLFGKVNYLNSNDDMQLKLGNNQTNSDEPLILNKFLFRYINKINTCSQIISNGVLGFGPNNGLLIRMKQNSVLDSIKYSNELSDDKESLQITIGDYSPAIKSADYNRKITYCNIVKSTFVNEYWGCNADIYLRTKHKEKSLRAQTILFYQILPEKSDDIDVIYFAGMKSAYQSFFMEGLFDNNPKCGVDIATDMITCDGDMDISTLPNLLFVMNDITYVFKPSHLLYKDNTNNKLVLKVKFPEANYNHIKFTQHFMFSYNISMAYNAEKNQVGFYGFNTHQYRGEDDDGNDEIDNGSYEWLIVGIIFVIVSVMIVGYVVYRYFNRSRNEGPANYIRY